MPVPLRHNTGSWAFCLRSWTIIFLHWNGGIYTGGCSIPSAGVKTNGHYDSDERRPLGRLRQKLGIRPFQRANGKGRDDSASIVEIAGVFRTSRPNLARDSALLNELWP